ncbi:hypothetical protein NUS41_01735 [Glaesserella parasuis]|nr:hypothetical protein [Glaesserella parasuis]
MGRDYTAKTPFHHAQHSLIDNKPFQKSLSFVCNMLLDSIKNIVPVFVQH